MRDPGSFRDPSGFIIYENDKVYRIVNKSYQKHYDHLMNSGLYECLAKDNWLVSHLENNDKSRTQDQYRILDVQKIFPITYPYEWSFSQLKDAALLTLDIQKKCVEYGMTLKDATPYNIQFRDNAPIFIDTLSFEMVENNFAWKPYRQFCEMFIGPLSLMSYKDPRLNKLLISFINGIPLPLINKLLSFRDKLRPSVFMHLVLHHWLSSTSNESSKKEGTTKTIGKKQHLNIITQLQSFVTKLAVLNEKSEWGDYNSETISEKKNYVEDKEVTINSFLQGLHFDLTWDIGSNDGYYSRVIANTYSKEVLSLDIDWKCVEKNYKINTKKSITNVFPILLDLSNPPPSIGWMNKERSNIYERIGSPDLICCFAIMHHIINDNIPISYFIDLLCRSTGHVLLEYVPISDPKCQKIFKSRGDDFEYPSKEYFEELLHKNFAILKSKTLDETERILYLLKKK